MTNKELFIQEVDKHWILLKNNDNTIFENIGIQIDAGNKYTELREKYEGLYNELLHENSVYEKKRMIKEYFWDRIVGDLYENTVDIMGQAGILEEANKSFDVSYKIEATARLILENGIFSKYSSSKKKEIVDVLIEATFYPSSYQDKQITFLSEMLTVDTGIDPLEENAFGDWLDNAKSTIGSGITGTARFVRSVQILLTMFLVSPASLLMGNTVDQALDYTSEKVFGKVPKNKGTNPTTRKFYAFLEQFWPVKIVYSFLNKDMESLYKFVNQTNNLEDPYVQDILKTAGGDSKKIVDKCWQQHKIQPTGSTRDTTNTYNNIMQFFSGKGLSNFLRNPQYMDDTQLSLVLKNDASDPKYQKRFFDFRVCVYEKLFEIILGYAKAIYSMDDQSYEIIKAANDVHKTKNYKAFFDLKPKQDNDAAMFTVMKSLVAIDSISVNLKERKGDLVADPYVDRFSQFLDQNVKEVYKELDEMANQRKFNADRYDEEDPDDETKAEKIAEERYNQKRSIFQ